MRLRTKMVRGPAQEDAKWAGRGSGHAPIMVEAGLRVDRRIQKKVLENADGWSNGWNLEGG